MANARMREAMPPAPPPRVVVTAVRETMVAESLPLMASQLPGLKPVLFLFGSSEVY